MKNPKCSPFCAKNITTKDVSVEWARMKTISHRRQRSVGRIQLAFVHHFHSHLFTHCVRCIVRAYCKRLDQNFRSSYQVHQCGSYDFHMWNIEIFNCTIQFAKALDKLWHCSALKLEFRANLKSRWSNQHKHFAMLSIYQVTQNTLLIGIIEFTKIYPIFSGEFQNWSFSFKIVFNFFFVFWICDCMSGYDICFLCTMYRVKLTLFSNEKYWKTCSNLTHQSHDCINWNS